MRHTYEKILQLELLSLGLSIIIGFIALFQASALFLIVSLYFLAISLVCDGYTHQYTSHRHFQAQKQFVRALLIVFLATALIFQL